MVDVCSVTGLYLHVVFADVIAMILRSKYQPGTKYIFEEITGAISTGGGWAGIRFLFILSDDNQRSGAGRCLNQTAQGNSLQRRIVTELFY